jgi:hypothetical protein
MEHVTATIETIAFISKKEGLITIAACFIPN